MTDDDPQDRWDPDRVAEGVEALDAAGYEPDTTYDSDAQPNQGDKGSRETAAASYVQMAIDFGGSLNMGAPLVERMHDDVRKAAAAQGYTVVFTPTGFTLVPMGEAPKQD